MAYKRSLCLYKAADVTVLDQCKEAFYWANNVHHKSILQKLAYLKQEPLYPYVISCSIVFPFYLPADWSGESDISLCYVTEPAPTKVWNLSPTPFFSSLFSHVGLLPFNRIVEQYFLLRVWSSLLTLQVLYQVFGHAMLFPVWNVDSEGSSTTKLGWQSRLQS